MLLNLQNIFKTSKTRVLVASAIFIALSIGLVLYLALSNNNLSNKSVPKTTISYQGNNIVFYKPDGFIDNGGNIPQRPVVVYTLYQQANQRGNIEGYLGIGIAKLTANDLANFNSFNSSLTSNPDDKAYQKAISPINSYATYFLSDYDLIRLTNATKFTNTKIKSNAWVFDLFASDSQHELNGKAIFTWTDKAVYYYALAVTPIKWQSDQATWQKMVDNISVK